LGAGSFELGIAHSGATPADVIALLDHVSFWISNSQARIDRSSF
jgi:hypothetical protein